MKILCSRWHIKKIALINHAQLIKLQIYFFLIFNDISERKSLNVEKKINEIYNNSFFHFSTINVF